MKQLVKPLIFWVILFTSLFTHGLLFAQDSVTVTGLIEDKEYDENGDVNTIIITFMDQDAEFITYQVVLDEAGKPLLNHIGETVEITGTLITDSEGNITISVTSYDVIEKIEVDISDDMDIDEE